jgi:hypothetical protein
MIPSFRTAGLVALAIGAFVCCALLCPVEATGCLAFALGTGFLLKDALLRTEHALPNGAATTNGTGIDLANSTRGEFVAECEAVVTAPALTTTQLGDGQTIAYHLYHDTAVGFGTETLIATLGTQTGAGGAGAAAAEYRLRLPSTVKRYLRLKTVKTGASNASTADAMLELAF